MLKLAKRYHIDVLQAITWNYSIAIMLTWLIYKPQLQGPKTNHLESYLLVGVLLPVLFLIISAAVRITGIVKTDIAQRLSLLVPILAAFFYFNEPLTNTKMAGIGVGIVAVLFAIPTGGTKRSQSGGLSWLYLLLVFAGFGAIDFLFKQISAFKDIPYTTSLFHCFIIAFIVSIVFLIVQIARKKTKFSFPHILIGWALGVANFGNILFYLKAHQALANRPSTVFASMNIGVIVLGALVGLMVFKEKLSALNIVGLAMALVSIVIITML